ncbi:MAG: PRC-barrel domain-containing protein [Ornithinimicrobium sp.]|uniref:PRC-barrel domain-containing protein n=1 Tax=Ornithinimicrobium sp. TaxID=1977084 RepID=UPI003D9B518B
MKFSEAQGRTVVSTSTAETVGRIDGFVVEPSAGSVVALELGSARSGDTLPWSSIKSFGIDAVTIESPAAVTTADEQLAALRGKDHSLIGKRVLSTDGDECGHVLDVDFDPGTGTVVRLLLGDEGRDVAGDQLVGVGSYAVVVEPE